MKGDFSRLRFDPARHVDAVLLQQGRPLLDADWNEQVAIERHRRETGTRDLVGDHGVPAEGGGFAIAARAALAFDGRDDYVSVVEPGSLTGAGLGAFTFEAWVSPRSGAGAAGGTIAACVRDFEPGEWLLGVEADGRISYKQVVAQPAAGESDLDGVAMSNVLSDVALRFDVFSHVALTVGPEGVAVYVDGDLAAHAPGITPPPGGPALRPLVLGALLRRGVGARHFAGQLQDVRVWSLARTEDDIQRDRRRALLRDEPGLMLYWPFEAPENGIVPDASGHGNDGQLGGGQPESMPGWVLRDLGIGRGRLYLDGILVENEERRWLSNQPDLPGAALPERTAGTQRFLVYLDVWKRHLSYLEDPTLREVALAGPDTTTRERVVWQVKVLPLAADGAGHADSWMLDWYGWVGLAEQSGRLRARRDPLATPGLGNQLYRVEVHHGDDGGSATVAEPLPTNGHVRVDDWNVDGLEWRVGEPVELFDALEASAHGRRWVTELVAVDSVSRTLTLAAPPGDVGAYRQPRLRRAATFKWSRENGSISFGVAHLDAVAGVATLFDLGHDEFALGEGDWVELADDASVLQRRPAPLCRVVAIDRARKTVKLSGVPSDGTGQDPSLHPVLRRWDQPGDDGTPPLATGVLAAQPGTWITLEDGVQVWFEGDGPYRTGDFWTIPARALGEDVEWPRDARGPLPRPPHGVRHHYAPLALVTVDDDHTTVMDYRQPFQSLTALTRGLTSFMQRSGDTVAGPLGVQGRLSVGGDLVVAGRIEAQLPPAAVGAEQIAPGAVTSEKLGADVGLVPAGCAILGPSPEPPPGFVYTGSSVSAGNPAWRRTLEVEGAGGVAAATVGGLIYVVAESGQLWAYDPASDQLVERSRMERGRTGSAVAAVGGRIYVVGGFDQVGKPVGTVAEYDVRADAWATRAPMPTPRGNLAAVGLGDRLFAIGGEVLGRLGPASSAVVEVYAPRSNSWTHAAPMPTPRSRLAATAARGKIVAVGGVRSALIPGRAPSLVARNEEYDPAANRWTRREPLRVARAGLAAAEHDGRIVVVGGDRALSLAGNGTVGSRQHEEYDPASDEWLDMPPLPAARAGWSLVSVGGTLFGVGRVPHHGRQGHGEAVIELVAQTLYVHRRETSGRAPAAEPEALFETPIR